MTRVAYGCAIFSTQKTPGICGPALLVSGRLEDEVPKEESSDTVGSEAITGIPKEAYRGRRLGRADGFAEALCCDPSGGPIGTPSAGTF